ncbi:unnamed protein product [Dimorphilus gyrociliatus]|uniref:Transmembrane protein 230 n=1 Tax=Dimorphilus gyrociliatus TaxID=2664684 RepID=A0A7I8V433_9ANNE|nr:unnamed protein product [Dimorphilus gyrociliatus]
MTIRERMSTEKTKYYRLKETSEGYVDLRFEQQIKRPIPYRAILLAVALFTCGTFFLVIGGMLVGGLIAEEYKDRTWPVLFLGAIMFIPGAYHVRLAYLAYKGYDGYSFDDIPTFE